MDDYPSKGGKKCITCSLITVFWIATKFWPSPLTYAVVSHMENFTETSSGWFSCKHVPICLRLSEVLIDK